jgi:hypothetical protein
MELVHPNLSELPSNKFTTIDTSITCKHWGNEKLNSPTLSTAIIVRLWLAPVY